MNVGSLIDLTIGDVHAGIAARHFNVEQIVLAHLDRIHQCDRDYNAFTYLNPQALDRARELDRRLAAGQFCGPLTGIPVAVKESIDVAGFPSSACWAPLAAKVGGIDIIPTRDAPVVTRLRQAGAVIIGKTNMPAFAADGTRATRSWAGAVHNARDRRLAPGGSSSGSATSVAAGFVMLGVAAETGGSIQNPASAQGIVGIRPTFGLVPNTGVLPLGGSVRDVIGPHARSICDAATLLEVLAGYTAEDPKTISSVGNRVSNKYRPTISRLNKTRIGLYGPGWRPTELPPETQRPYQRAIEVFQSLGASIVEDPFHRTEFSELASLIKPNAIAFGTDSIAYDLDQYYARSKNTYGFDTLNAVLSRVGESPFEAAGPLHRRGQLPSVQAFLTGSEYIPDLSQFILARERYLNIFNETMVLQKLDALVLPQRIGRLPLIDSSESIQAAASPEINVLGVPGVAVPAGFDGDGAPFGLLFVGRAWDEAKLLSIAHTFEQATLSKF